VKQFEEMGNASDKLATGLKHGVPALTEEDVVQQGK
jgi:hypothetical protein